MSTDEPIIDFSPPERRGLGVHITAPNPRLHPSVNQYGAPAGPCLRKVLPGSPAQKAGLRDGDMIVAANGEPFENLPASGQGVIDAFMRFLETAPDVFELTVQRGKETFVVFVNLRA